LNGKYFMFWFSEKGVVLSLSTTTTATARDPTKPLAWHEAIREAIDWLLAR
jgi:hypothetical protein